TERRGMPQPRRSTATLPGPRTPWCPPQQVAPAAATRGGARSCECKTEAMNTAVLVIGSLFAGIAALIHVYIWLLESVLWTSESTRRTFGVKSAADAETLRPMAYNHGFYNLFLALG